jgi:hypothetical protein
MGITNDRSSIPRHILSADFYGILPKKRLKLLANLIRTENSCRGFYAPRAINIVNGKIDGVITRVTV